MNRAPTFPPSSRTSLARGARLRARGALQLAGVALVCAVAGGALNGCVQLLGEIDASGAASLTGETVKYRVLTALDDPNPVLVCLRGGGESDWRAAGTELTPAAGELTLNSRGMTPYRARAPGKVDIGFSTTTSCQDAKSRQVVDLERPGAWYTVLISEGSTRAVTLVPGAAVPNGARVLDTSVGTGPKDVVVWQPYSVGAKTTYFGITTQFELDYPPRVFSPLYTDPDGRFTVDEFGILVSKVGDVGRTRRWDIRNTTQRLNLATFEFTEAERDAMSEQPLTLTLTGGVAGLRLFACVDQLDLSASAPSDCFEGAPANAADSTIVVENTADIAVGVCIKAYEQRKFSELAAPPVVAAGGTKEITVAADDYKIGLVGEGKSCAELSEDSALKFPVPPLNIPDDYFVAGEAFSADGSAVPASQLRYELRISGSGTVSSLSVTRKKL